MLIPKNPKNIKYNKVQRGRLKGKAIRNNKLINGLVGIQALEPIWLSTLQIETCCKIILKYLKRIGKLWIRIFPHKPITARAEESRMGSGKGLVKYWAASILPGTILFELSDIQKEIGINILKKISYKLPIKTKILSKI